MTNQQNEGRKTHKRFGPKLVVMGLAYLCVLAVAIRVDGLVEAQAQYQEMVDRAAQVRSANVLAVDTARKESQALVQVTAGALSTVQAQDQQARIEKALTTTAPAAAAKTPVAPAAPPPPATFQAAAYGYSGRDKLAYWQSINNDTIAYLRVPGTNINYAVVQNNQDVNYYTALGYDKQPNRNGVLWTNPNTNSAGSSAAMSSNTVIYGHNWTNYGTYPRIGSSGDVMFGQLTAYHHLSMAKSYPYFYYSTAAEEMTFKIFACFYTEPQFQYIQTEGATQSIVSEALLRSRHNFNTDVNGNDKIITLSTCTRAYGATENQRFVVMGRLLRPGETISEVNVVAAPNHKQPSVW